MIQGSESREAPRYAFTIYQLLSGAGEPGMAVARAATAWNGGDADFRSIVRAAGAFAKDNDGYFLRYREDGATQEPEPLPPATHLLVFPVPVEPRMRVAYSYMQGLLLKYLYVGHEAVPREVRQGVAELVSDNPLPEADELWTEFLKSGVAESAIAVSAGNWTAGSNIGKQAVDDAFISESYLLGLAKAIAARPSAFQWQGGDQIPSFRKEDLGELADREALMTREDPEAAEFRTANRYKEWSTLQVYEWLERESRETPEFEELVEVSLKALEGNDGTQEISLQAAAETLEEAFRAEFVPRSSRLDWTALAVPKITAYLLLWALVDRFTTQEDGKLTFFGWDLAYLKAMRENFDTAGLRGSLKFMDKNDPKKGTKTQVKLVGFDKLKAEIRLGKKESDSLSAAPFDLESFGDARSGDSGIESGGRVCTVCGKSGELSTASILPESKKRHYDSPQTNNPAEVCARCVQVWSLAPISTADDSYSIVEVPVENFLELFALYESLEGINRLETLKTLNKVSSLSVFPSKYLLLSRSSGKGKMPQIAQYYLQLARQSHFLKRLKNEGALEVIAAQDRAKLAREVSLVLSALRRLPPYYATSSEDKIPAISIINALDRGRPYEALYVVAAQAQEAGRGETQTIVDGVAGYDGMVGAFDEFFVRRQKGEDMNREIFRDVREFSDYLYSILRPIVLREVNESKSSVSGVARKYTENITKSFVRVNTADFLYRISSFVEGRERQDLRQGSQDGGKMKGSTKNRIYGTGLENTESEEAQSELKLEQELERYYEQYADNERDWKTFLEEVEARTLALLLLNVRNQRGRG
ncbi:MAG: hypothetical protein M3Q62_02245 [Actinomycetota bacterium]|nr:hypothetical protein [Actinomycetota bacterium]